MKSKEQKNLNGLKTTKQSKEKKNIKVSLGHRAWDWAKFCIIITPWVILLVFGSYYYYHVYESPILSRGETDLSTEDNQQTRSYNFSLNEEELIISSFIRHKTNNRTPQIVADYIAYWLTRKCEKYGIDYSFSLAKMYVESAYDPANCNKKTKAAGLMQLISEGVGCEWVSIEGQKKKVKKCKETFDTEEWYNIPENIEYGLKIFKEKLDIVQKEQEKKFKGQYRRRKKENLLGEALERYVGASTPEGKKIAKQYITDIYTVQGEYVMWKHLWLKDKKKNSMTIIH